MAKFKLRDESAKVARELTGSISGWVRSAVEPIATVTLDPEKAVAVTGQAERPR